MGESFLINIDCSKILNNEETQYAMFIDGDKMSIVFELIEWIRWMFSIPQCIYLTHENAVIHELEDIQVLSRLKNFEIKPCGRFHCVHTRLYRNLLKKFNLYVTWNETRVHKYFLEKVIQMSKKLDLERSITESYLKSVESSDFVENETYEISDNDCIRPELKLLNKLSPNPKLENSTSNQTLTAFENFGCKINANTAFSKEMNGSFNNSKQSNKSYYEDSNRSKTCDSFRKISNCSDTTSASSAKAHSSLKNEPTIVDETKNLLTSSKTLRSKNRPFSIGEMLSDLRNSQNIKEETEHQFNSLSSFSTKDKNFGEKITLTDNLFLNDIEKICKRRQRTRRRKKPARKNSENNYLVSLVSEPVPFRSPNSNSNFRPNHIRFEIDDETNLLESECNEKKFKEPNKNEVEIFEKKTENPIFMSPKSEPEKLVMLTNSSQALSETPSVNPVMNNNENKMECSDIDNQTNNEEKLIDLDDPNCIEDNKTEDVQGGIYSQSSNNLSALKDKFKNAVFIERHY